MWEPNLTPAPNLAAGGAEGPVFRIVDAVYGPPLGEALPLAYNHRLPLELQRRCAAQLAELLARPLFLPAGSLNSIFSDPAPLITKELRIAVASPRNEVHVATFNEYEDIRFTTLEFLWKQSPPLALQPTAPQGARGHPAAPGAPGSAGQAVGARRGGRGGWEWASGGLSLSVCFGGCRAAALALVVEQREVCLRPAEDRPPEHHTNAFATAPIVGVLMPRDVSAGAPSSSCGKSNAPSSAVPRGALNFKFWIRRLTGRKLHQMMLVRSAQRCII